jgi:hypothetical protein
MNLLPVSHAFFPLGGNTVNGGDAHGREEQKAQDWGLFSVLDEMSTG